MGVVMLDLIDILIDILRGIGSLFIRSGSDIDRIEVQIERREQRNGWGQTNARSSGASNTIIEARRKRSEMERLRELLKTLDGQPVRPTAGPNSLYEAGRVGATPDGRPVRRVVPRDASIDSAADPTAEERTVRRQRAVSQTSQPAVPPAARQIRAALRDPESLRTAILLREVLDPPVSQRPRKR